MPARDDPVPDSTIALAALLAHEATGERVSACRAAIQRWVTHSVAMGMSDREITQRLTGRAAGHDEMSRRRWTALLQRFGNPTTREGASPR